MVNCYGMVFAVRRYDMLHTDGKGHTAVPALLACNVDVGARPLFQVPDYAHHKKISNNNFFCCSLKGLWAVDHYFADLKGPGKCFGLTGFSGELIRARTSSITKFLLGLLHL